MAPSVTFEVPVELDGERVDKIVAVLGEMSRAEARTLVDEGRVLSDDVPLTAKQRMSAGTSITFPPAPPAAEMQPEAIDLHVIHDDRQIIVVDKPSGLVVHPGAGRVGGTLAAGLLARYPELRGVGQVGRWGIVHRLDRETSGLLVVARTAEAYDSLTRSMRRREIGRSYLAGVQGMFAIPRGTIEAPIGRDPHHPTRRAMVPNGRRAVTHFRMTSQWDPPGVALVEVRLETGRTHQIRVHMAGIDHPVLGDRVYGGRDPIQVPRMFLHAFRLELAHPTTGEELVYESPLPDDLQTVIDGLNRPD